MDRCGSIRVQPHIAVCHEKPIGFNYTNSITAKTNPTVDKVETLRASGGGGAAVCYALDRASFNQGINAKYDPSITDDGISQTIVSRGPGAVCARTLNTIDRPAVADKSEGYAVRRLTPLECERLQGFPDGWTDIGDWVDEKGKTRQTTDAARYKALGNSIAIPPWKWVLKRLCANYERDATMASLFDGIGGFPLIWEQLNGRGSCLWASEIEEFPIAVTKRHFQGVTT